MKISPHRFSVFKRFFLILFAMLTLVVVIPEIINYFVKWLPPVPDKERLLRWLWVVPLASFTGAIIAALVARNDEREEK